MQPVKEQTIRQKLGSILGLGASRTTPTPQKSHDDMTDHSTFFTEDVLRELDRRVPVQQRVRAMKELREIVATKRLEEHAVESIWLAIKDLLHSSQPTEVRHTTLAFTKALIYGQFEDLGILRTHFFLVVKQHNVREDIQQRLGILRVLTQDGKNIRHMEEGIGPFLCEWMPEAVKFGRPVDFLSLLVNFVHYNATYLDEDILIGLVQQSCGLAIKSTLPNVIELCLDFLNAVVCYSFLPADALLPFVTTLCHTLNIERFSKKSLDVMLRLLGTHLGRNAIYTMCTLIQERSGGQDALLLRGAVFYISMSMWGIRRVENIDLSFASVLLPIKRVVQSGHTIVVYEVALSLSRLIRTHSQHLHQLEWDCIYDIMSAIQDHMIQQQVAAGETQQQQQQALSSSNSLGQCLREMFMAIEQLYEHGVNIGSPENFFELVEGSMKTMPLSSVLTLMSYRKSMIDTTEEGWIDQVTHFMEKFYKHETRSAIRVGALNYFGTVIEENSLSHEGDLMDKVVLPLLSPIAKDPDVEVRCRAAQLLVHLLSTAAPQWAGKLLSIVSSILQSGLQAAARFRMKEDKSQEGPRLADSKPAVFGLTTVFKEKLYSSSPVAAQVLSLLVALLYQHYDEQCFYPSACVMRINIFNCILSVRSNEFGQVGYLEKDGTIHYSPFFVCCSSESPGLPFSTSSSTASTSSFTPTSLHYRSALATVLTCLEKEREWEVMAEVFHNLGGVLQDRVLTLSSMPDLSPLCQLLCQMITGEHKKKRKWSKSNLASCVFHVLSTLITYPSHLDRRAQHTLVLCLESGLVGKSAQLCVSALTLCSLELQATMTHLLPRVLYRLGQVAATPTMALPVLEFLSSLIPISSLYSGFVEKEYLLVFAIALPYSNHQKYSPYVIAMAHRVIAQWFVQCRIQYRPAIASFIYKSLSVDIDAQCQPLGLPTSPLMMMSASVRSEGGEGGVGMELADVCLDMMARYTYSNLSTLPSRSSGADFLLSGGPSKTWVVADSLVTITTSGQGGGRTGVCKRCASIRTKRDPVEPFQSEIDSEALCSCWCKGWAEIKIRRPTGNTSWLMRLQNRLHPLSLTNPASLSVPESDLGLLSVSMLSSQGATEAEEDVTLSNRLSDKDGTMLSREMYETVSEDMLEETVVVEPPIAPATRDGGDSTPELLEPIREDSDSGSEQLSNDIDDVTPGRIPLNVIKESSELVSPLSPKVPQVGETQNDDGCLTEQGPEAGGIKLHSLMENERAAHPVFTPLQAIPNHLESETQPNKGQAHTSSQSWSEAGQVSPLPLSPKASSCSKLFSLEHLPPLPAYDEEDGYGRSPSLHEDAKVLSEEEQLNLYAGLTDLVLSDEYNSSAGSDTPTGSLTGSSSSLTSLQDPIPIIKHSTPSQPHPPPSRLHHLSQAADGETPMEKRIKKEEDEERKLPPFDTGKLTPSPGPQRRKSAPVSTPPSVSPAIGRKKLVFTRSKSGPNLEPEPDPVKKEWELYNNPSFIFLQLFSCCTFAEPADRPPLLPKNEAMERAVKMLDHIPPYDTHKIGVVYIGPGQTTESEILSNTFGSSRYLEFLRGLGSLLRLEDVPRDMVYLGGLDQSGTDGKFAYCYHDDITQVIFHVATLMPTDLTSDPKCSGKKLHIGNDFVTIVYNDSGTKYKFGTISGHFNFVEVEVTPLSGIMNRVRVRAKRGMDITLSNDPQYFISDSWLPLLVRQKALQANLASLVHVSCSESSAPSSEHYLTNWLGRLKQIRRIREKCLQDDHATSSKGHTDFTQYS